MLQAVGAGELSSEDAKKTLAELRRTMFLVEERVVLKGVLIDEKMPSLEGVAIVPYQQADLERLKEDLKLKERMVLEKVKALDGQQLLKGANLHAPKGAADERVTLQGHQDALGLQMKEVGDQELRLRMQEIELQNELSRVLRDGVEGRMVRLGRLLEKPARSLEELDPQGRYSLEVELRTARELELKARELAGKTSVDAKGRLKERLARRKEASGEQANLESKILDAERALMER